MKIIFAYKGRYHIRDANIIEHLCSIAKIYGHQTDLVFDQDVFGATDNVISQPCLNRIFSDDNRTVNRVIKKNAQVLVFLDGFNRNPWNESIAAGVKKADSVMARVFLSGRDYVPEAQIYDYVLLGEPELAWERFLREGGMDSEKGIYRYQGLADLNELPLPDKDLFRPYLNFRDSYLIYTSKGCPYGCSYCEETIYKDKLSPDYFRRRNPEHVLQELANAKAKFGIREVIYKDSVFAWDKDWLKSYLPQYSKQIKAPYKCFGKAGNFDDELALMLKDSGCYCVEFGAQTFNARLKQEILDRSETEQVLRQAFSVCDRQKLRYDIDHLFGIPGESVADHKQGARAYLNLKYLNRIKCHNLTFYQDAPIYKYAPESVKKSEPYSADFFSYVSGRQDMLVANKAFQKYFKILKLLPRGAHYFILKDRRWRVFRFVPGLAVVFFMIILALKNKDRRFWVYLTYFPQKVIHGILATLSR